MESILGSKFSSVGRKKQPYNREEALVAVKAAQQGANAQQIYEALKRANVGPERTLLSVHHLLRNRLRPITSMAEFDRIFPKPAEPVEIDLDEVAE